jgi:hypothetical protein
MAIEWKVCLFNWQILEEFKLPKTADLTNDQDLAFGDQA